MALAKATALVFGLTLGFVAQAAQSQATPTVVSPPRSVATEGAETPDATLSPECRVPSSKLYALNGLTAVKAALAEKRPVRILAVGAPAASAGASTSYPVKLESALERSIPTIDVEIEGRGLPGEIASGAAERMRAMVAEFEPDLVIWQVGTHDALARVDIEVFADALTDAVQWIKSHDMDVVLVDPLYTASLADDAYYSSIVQRVKAIAAREKVPLVQRYEAMRYLASHAGDKGEAHMLGQQFRLNDLGLRCMAEHVSRAISLSLLQTPLATVAPSTEGARAAAPAEASPAGEPASR
ncbi:SGNH/GDSL hydrolase family protein [uncultured Methylobacterium sp.]|jgi:hypothetical protein|uniref:SGNH/GDSL hydrolase family protein n=1 Tax=uncultured Methylobacterium sp. TaxID=157278 RepID=UPI0035C97B87